MELKPNMYVRTIDGIMKLKNIYQDGRENMDRFENEDGNIYFFNEIIGEPSFNPIDLIEVGDYVNGEKVDYIDDCDGAMREYYYNYEDASIDVGHWCEEIKSIVTKEQFSSMEYRLGDK